METKAMHLAKNLTIYAIVAMILFSSSMPVYASHIKFKEPSADEKRLFETILARLENHSSMMQVQVDNVEKSLSEPIKIFFSCNPFKDADVESVSINLRTRLASFDRQLAEKHTTGMLSGMYVWDCTGVKDRYVLTIECLNTIMLNPDFLIKEETETDEKRMVALAENEMVLYHEFLHGELMIDAMNDFNDGKGWRKNACSFFTSNENKIDYGPSDGEHRIISAIELDYLAKLVNQQEGKLIIKTIERENVGKSEFTHLVATFDELGALAKRGFFVFARAINMGSAEILVSMQQKTVSVKGYLEDPNRDGIVRVFVLPKTNVSNVALDLTVDDVFKSEGSEFVFTASVQNHQGNDVSGTVRLGIDGMVVASREVNVLANGIENVSFVWRSNDFSASKHIARVDGFNNASSEIAIFTYDKFQSGTARSIGTITEQVFVDPETNERISIARPNRVSGMIMIDRDIDTEVQLIAPDGTAVIGKKALVNDVGSKAHVVNVAGTNLVVKYTELNESLQFFAIKTALSDVPLPSGDWSIKTVDSNGEDADARIKYYASYIGNIL